MMLLDMLPPVQHSSYDLGVEPGDFPSALDLGLEAFSTVGVF
jgi:hypothetical protein